MSQDPNFVREAFSKIAPRYALANHVLSGGIDILWRKKVARMVSDYGPERLLDLATGTGDLALEIQRACPDLEIVAADFCPEMLKIATEAGVSNTMVADAMDLPFEDGSFDVVTVGYGLRNMSSWEGALREMRRVLRPGGKLVVLDFSLPEQPAFRGIYRFYLHRILPVLAGAIAGNREAYDYLSESIERFPSGAEMGALLLKSGYENWDWTPLTGGISSIYVADNPSA